MKDNNLEGIKKTNADLAGLEAELKKCKKRIDNIEKKILLEYF